MKSTADEASIDLFRAARECRFLGIRMMYYNAAHEH